ncbi:holo-ACP synthase [Kangiella sediminilitoris]|uniref:Holo-[acyl-carrier-protein] synthase n=1 Tax=Kangiella sediminilitoris TaxID=1144748 RepID=A0A1B3BCB5_9GAMM|nr:holo-ACP synthase [Kangiella sediminilitoris]AOE50393.1 4''''-phosphopantetheinyl transferase [Kangiella sediminilitoris]
MAIFGVGTDIVSLARIERSFQRHGDKFAERILSDIELNEYQQKKNKQAYLAKRFAAKEAISKALGTGMRKGIHFQQLVIVSSELGKPEVQLYGAAKDWASKQHINTIHLTISDERDFAVAFAVAESK